MSSLCALCWIMVITLIIVSNSVEAGIFGLSYRMVRKMADKYDADLKRNQRPEFYNREIVMDRDEIYQDHKHTLRMIKKKIEKSNTDGSLKGQRGKKEVEVKPKKKRTYKKKKDENPPVTNLKQIDSPRKQYPYEKAIPEKTQTYSEGSYKGQQGKKKPVVRYIKKRTYQKDD